MFVRNTSLICFSLYRCLWIAALFSVFALKGQCRELDCGPFAKTLQKDSLCLLWQEGTYAEIISRLKHVKLSDTTLLPDSVPIAQLWILSQVYREKGEDRLAFDYFSSYITLRDKMMERERHKLMHSMEGAYELLRRNKKLAEQEMIISHRRQEDLRQRTWIWTLGLSITGGLLITTFIYINYKRGKSLSLTTERNLQRHWAIEQAEAQYAGQRTERERITDRLEQRSVADLNNLSEKLSAFAAAFPSLAHTGPFRTGEKMVELVRSELKIICEDRLPEELEQKGLLAAMKGFVERVKVNRNITIELGTEGVYKELSNEYALLLYRIAQELVQNIIKHARATWIWIHIEFMPECVVLQVRDNGIGMDGADRGRGMGLSAIEQRISVLDGNVHIASETGTTVTIALPL